MDAMAYAMHATLAESREDVFAIEMREDARAFVCRNLHPDVLYVDVCCRHELSAHLDLYVAGQ